MTLDELLKQNAAWLEQTLKRPVFDKVDDKTTKLPDEQRERRMAELKARIADLSRRKQEVAASYDRAIALEQAELKNLEAQKPPTVRPDRTEPGPDKPTRPKQKSTPRRAKRK